MSTVTHHLLTETASAAFPDPEESDNVAINRGMILSDDSNSQAVIDALKTKIMPVEPTIMTGEADDLKCAVIIGGSSNKTMTLPYQLAEALSAASVLVYFACEYMFSPEGHAFLKALPVLADKDNVEFFVPMPAAKEDLLWQMGYLIYMRHCLQSALQRATGSDYFILAVAIAFWC